MKGINLLQKSAIESEPVLKQKRKIFVYTVIILVSFALLNLLIFIFRLKQKEDLIKINGQLNNQKNLIVSLKDREIKYYILKEKLGSLVLINKEKTDFSSLISFLEELENRGAEFGSITFTLDKITFSANTANSKNLSSILSLLVEEDEGKKKFRNVVLSSLNQDSQGKYSFTITLTPKI